MATQGIVTIVKDQQVVIKIIAGSDGGNAIRLANRIKKIGEPITSYSLAEIYEIAKKSDFGSDDDLVVMNSEEALFKGEEDLSPLYRRTFKDPEFNPRWELGLAEYCKIISF